MVKREVVKAVIFDADGTLLDSCDWSLKYCRQTAEYLGLRIPKREEFLAVWALPWEQLLNALWPGVDVPTFNRACDALKKKRIPPVPGAKKVLKKLKKKECFLALISNRDKDSLKENMAQAGIGLDIFDYVQAVDDFQFTKPDPRVFDGALSLMSKKGITKEMVVFIGDTISDFQAAKAAGIEFIGVLTGGANKQQFLIAGLDELHILDSVRDLPKFLAKRMNVVRNK